MVVIDTQPKVIFELEILNCFSNKVRQAFGSFGVNVNHDDKVHTKVIVLIFS